MSAFISQILQALLGQIITAKITGGDTPDDPGKSIFQSKTAWGMGISALAFASQAFGWGLDEQDINATAEMVKVAVDAGLLAIGSLLTLYGRVKAKTQVGAG